jgi:Zn-dependent protease with chaperone function
MDFFAQQDEATRRSRVLVWYLILSVVLTVVAVYAAATAIFVSMGSHGGGGDSPFWSAPRFAAVAGCTLALIVAGTLYKMAELSGGGAAVARALGGRLIPPNSTDLHERRALNVVEEMALASGTPVPALYVMDDEPRINAFAAGTSPGNAVVALTRGALDSLTRDELQAVVGHEFSHVLNGDMRLNIRLIGLLNGILLLAMVGKGILRSLGRARRSSSKKGGGAAPVALFAVALILIGLIGVFFARLIKSAVSRQREYLADASSAQFTRNPLGLASALRKIARAGSMVSSPAAEEASHLFFADALRSSWLSLLATHPPIGERIRRLDPHGASGQAAEAPAARRTQPDLAPGVSAHAVSMLTPASVTSRVGYPDGASLAGAESFLRDLAPSLLDAARDPTLAVRLALATLLDARPDVREKQLISLRATLGAGEAEAIAAFADSVRSAGPHTRLPLLALAVPALRTLAPPQFVRFEALADAMVRADMQVDLFEFVMKRMVVRHVEPAFRAAPVPRSASLGLPELKEPLGRLMSCLAYWGADTEEQAAKAFAAAAAELPSHLGLSMLPADSCGLAELGSALDELGAVSFEHRRRILRACVACVGSDRVATVEEAEILRAVADSIDCPVPPILAGPVHAAA